jgi:AraC-like DNA-binding protein
MRAGRSFEPHLVIHELALPRSAEWIPQLRGWTLVQIRTGIGYWQQPGRAQELPPGSAVVMTWHAQGVFRASQLSDVTLTYACVEPERLSGLLSLGEEQALQRAAEMDQFASRVFPPGDPLPSRFNMLCQSKSREGESFSLRLQLVQLFSDCFGPALKEQPAVPLPVADGRGRLRQLLKEMAASEFTEISLADLAPRMNCSPRHLSRLFREEIGMSFQDKQTQLRLAKACHLLTTTNAKVIDVGAASGYQSNSLFSLMFKKHFGLSPGRWRQQHRKTQPGRQKIVRMLSV